MKKRILMLVLIAVMLVCLAICVSAEDAATDTGEETTETTVAVPDTSEECVTLDDGTVIPIWDTAGDALIWYKSTANADDGYANYDYVKAQDSSVVKFTANGNYKAAGGTYYNEVTNATINGKNVRDIVVVFNMNDPDVVITDGSKAGQAFTGFKDIFSWSGTLEYAFLRSDLIAIMKNGMPGCTKLKYVNFEELTSLEEVGEASFSENPLLFANATLDLSKTKLAKIGQNAFGGSGNNTAKRCKYSAVSLPTTLKELGGYPFQYNTVLTTVNGLENTKLKSIANSMFRECTSLSTVSLPSTITSIGEYAFYNTSLTEVTIPNGVTSIGQYAFSECKSLVTVKMPTTLTKLNACVFRNSTALEFVDFGDNQNTFDMPSWGVFMGCTSLKAISLPAKTLTIPDRGFSGCTSLTAVYLGEELKYIKGNKGEGSGDGPAFVNNGLMYFVQEPFDVIKADGTFYTAEEFTPPSRPDVYYFPSTLLAVVNTGNPNAYMWMNEFSYSYTKNDAGNYELNIDENGYPVINTTSAGVYVYDTGRPVYDANNTKITNLFAYLYEYERDENGNLVFEEYKTTEKVNGTNVTVYYYRPIIKRDDDGNVVYRTDANGEKIAVYDADGRHRFFGIDEYGNVISDGSGAGDIGISNCKNLNPVLVFPEGFTGYNDATGSYDQNQRGDCLTEGMITNCATKENPLTLVFLGRIDRLSMDRRNGKTSYMTFVFANPENTGFENTVIGSYYDTNAYYSNQNEMYVVFCHAVGGAQRYQIKFVASEANTKVPIMTPTLVEGTTHIDNPRADGVRVTDATCTENQKSFDICFCGAHFNFVDIENTALGHDEYIVSIVYENGNFLADGKKHLACNRTDCDYESEAVAYAIFTGFLYATREEDDGKCGLVFTYEINLEALNEYQTIVGYELVFGALSVAQHNLNGTSPINGTDGKANQDKVVRAQLSGTGVCHVDYIIRGQADAWNAVFDKETGATVKDVEFYILGYVIENGSVNYFLGENTNGDITNLSTITYNLATNK